MDTTANGATIESEGKKPLFFGFLGGGLHCGFSKKSQTDRSSDGERGPAMPACNWTLHRRADASPTIDATIISARRLCERAKVKPENLKLKKKY